MYLSEMRDMVRTMIFDRASVTTQQPFATTELDRFINAAMHHVYNLLRALKQDSLFVTNATVDITATTERWKLLDGELLLDYPAESVVEKVLEAYRTDAPAGRCAVVDFADYWTKAKGSAQPHPAVALYNNNIAVLEPPASATLELTFIHALPNMTVDQNSPGQIGQDPELGGVKFIPEHYQPLIVTKAAVLALKSERAPDWTSLQQEYQEQKEQVIASLQQRDDTSEDG